MWYEIEIEIMADAPPNCEVLVWRAAQQALNHHDGRPGDALTVLLADDDTLCSLNRQFRGEDRPTDVLSFAAGDMPPPPPDSAAPGRYLGDIAISVPTAERQARQQGHAVVEELQLLTVHGVLHLLGYDHATAVEKAAMWAAQDRVLVALDLGHVRPTEDDGEH